MAEVDNQLALASTLTAKTQQLCLGLESGVAEILDLVTPTTSELLKWWFSDDMIAARHAQFSRGAEAGDPERDRAA